MRRLLTLLMLLCLLTGSCLGEEAVLSAPSIRKAVTPEEAETYLMMPSKYNLAGVERGYIRYIGQNAEKDDMFRKGYWLGGKEGSVLDLTVKARDGVPYAFHAGTMCSRAAYSMAMSYLGIDITPGEMSEMMHSRNLDEPYDMISWLLGVERLQGSYRTFNDMVENYLTDERYSPVYIYLRKPSGAHHALLVVGVIPDKGRFIVVDSNPIRSGGKPQRVYFISFNKARTEIINSSFKKEWVGSELLQVHQWRLQEIAAEDPAATPTPDIAVLTPLTPAPTAETP